MNIFTGFQSKMKTIDLWTVLRFLAHISPFILLAASEDMEPAVRVVRFRVDYPNADVTQVNRLQNWATIMRKSVLASLKFVNKHWYNSTFILIDCMLYLFTGQCVDKVSDWKRLSGLSHFSII